jgi:hypothetical protein
LISQRIAKLCLRKIELARTTIFAGLSVFGATKCFAIACHLNGQKLGDTFLKCVLPKLIDVIEMVTKW